MEWSTVGEWVSKNAGAGAALVGSLITGNIPAAVAAGISLVSSATGTADPAKALQELQSDPATLVRLRELALQEEAAIREHIRAMTAAQLADAQAEHRETQQTIRAGDVVEDAFVRRTRPGQSWLSLFAALLYVGYGVVSDKSVDATILTLLLSLSWAYAGLRQIGKGIDSIMHNK